MRLKHARVFDVDKGFVEREVCIAGEYIAENSDGETLSLAGCYLIPGLCDVHVHGCFGGDVSDACVKGLRTMANYQLSRGVTQFLPAAMSLPAERLEAICTAVLHHCEQANEGADVLGLYLEGPFLNGQKAGAQKVDFLCEPEVALVRHLQKAAGGLIRTLAIAPELKGALSLIRALKGEMVLSLGHTACRYDEAMLAFEAGASQVTHLFNAMEPFFHREPGLVGAAADANAYVELISDGVHLHPAVVRASFCLFGAQRVLLVSDSMRATGLPDGLYSLGGQPVQVQNGRAVLENGTLAGSASDLMDCLRKAVSFGIPLQEAVLAAAVNPAKALGIYHTVGSLCVGKLANLVVLREDLSLWGVLFRGKWQKTDGAGVFLDDDG